MVVFCVVAPCSLVEVYQSFRGSCCLHHQGDRYNPEESHLRTHCRENLKSYLKMISKYRYIFSYLSPNILITIKFFYFLNITTESEDFEVRASAIQYKLTHNFRNLIRWN
jgi:hypothetical protein